MMGVLAEKSGPGVARYKVTLGDDPAAADGTLTGLAESVVRLVYGRLDRAHTPATLTLDSDAVTLDQLRAVFPGI